MLPLVQEALNTALPVPELHALVAAYDSIMTANEITQLAVALIVADNDQTQLTEHEQDNLRSLRHNVHSLDMRAIRFRTVDTSVKANGDIDHAVTEAGNRFCGMLHAFPRLLRLIYSGPVINVDMPQIALDFNLKWPHLFNESGTRTAAETAVSILEVAPPAALTTVVLDDQQADFRLRMQALAIVE